MRSILRRASKPSGVLLTPAARISSDIQPVSIGPGLMALALMPRCAELVCGS